MKNKLISLLIVIVLIFLSTITLASDTDEGPWVDYYGHYMHEIFETFTNARLSATLKQYDIADIHLKQMQENIKQAEHYIPPMTKGSTKIDKELTVKRLEHLNNQVSDLRTAIKERESEFAKNLSGEIFNMCTSCHTQERLNYLFKVTGRRTIFGTYMHEISEHFDLARMNMTEKKDTGKVNDELDMINFYLGLLADTAPDYGPSGVIMDRDTFIRRLKEAQEATNVVQKNLRGKKSIDFGKYKKDINGFCVLCHEPDRIK